MISEQKIYSILNHSIPGFEATSELQPIEGGNLNHLWRICDRNKKLIIKWAPPHIASNPEVSLSPERIAIEAKALQLFEEDGLLYSFIDEQLRPPQIYVYDKNQHLLLMEDLGQIPSLDQWLGDNNLDSIGERLGTFIGNIHRRTFGKKELSQRFDNHDIQQTRLEVQYKPAADYALASRAQGIDLNLIRSKTQMLGNQLMETGCCLIMGDLWPPSILVDRGNLYIIDWEFSHFGYPLQDVGHFAAHCWMQAHMASFESQENRFKQLWGQFWKSYKKSMGEQISELDLDGMMTHAGAEILIRVCGPFQKGYVYEECEADSLPVRQAVNKVQQIIASACITKLWEK
ncbi:phosphotransferase [Fodinibius saliphilus]|uniref:phosphotransferase n=1 Tax=Fodinibius saliphilus TaxID=1920650 RepID=UPI00110836F5|nr:phosphotransferase [Fodinibius saliphilus]